MKLILKYLKKYKLLFLIDAISVFGFALVELGIPTLISRMIDQGVNTKDTSFLWSNWALMSIISIVGVCGTVILGYCSTRISTNVTRDIRNDVFEHAMTFSSAEMDKFGVSSMITRTNNDAYQIMLFLDDSGYDDRIHHVDRSYIATTVIYRFINDSFYFDWCICCS